MKLVDADRVLRVGDAVTVLVCLVYLSCLFVLGDGNPANMDEEKTECSTTGALLGSNPSSGRDLTASFKNQSKVEKND